MVEYLIPNESTPPFHL